MEALTRLETLRQLIHEGNQNLRWFGGVAIQKAVYLLQAVYHVDLGYTYGLHHLGPYSPELSADLQLGEQVGLWLSPEGGDSGWPGQIYEISPAEWPEDVAEEVARRWRDCEPIVHAAMADFKTLKIDAARPFELVGTTHYLHHVQKIPRHDIPDMLRLLKPKYSEDDVRQGAELLAALEAAAAGKTLPKPAPVLTELKLKLVPPAPPEPMDAEREIMDKPRGRTKFIPPPAPNLSLFEGM